MGCCWRRQPRRHLRTKSNAGAVYLFKGPEPGQFELVAGDGDEDNHFFSIFGDKLQVFTPLNYEHKAEYSIRVRGRDDTD